MNKQELSALQKVWYAKLKDCGFKDIEKLHNGELVAIHDAHANATRARHRDAGAAKFAYYRAMAQKVRDEHSVFRNTVDRFILERHVDGAKIKTIFEDLHAKGLHRNRCTIGIIIRRYAIQWNIKRK